MGLIRVAVVVVLAAVVASMGMALYYLATDRGGSGRLVQSLTVRIVLSVALFALLMIAWRFGLIRPHGLRQ